MTDSRFFENNPSQLGTVTEPRQFLLESLKNLVTKYPPSQAAQDRRLGFFKGPTSIAYLFFHLSITHPTLEVEGKKPGSWLDEYLDLPEPQLDVQILGTRNEYLCWTGLKAVRTGESSYLAKLLAGLQQIPSQSNPMVKDLLIGGAGTLVILRFVKTFMPSSAAQLDPFMTSIAQTLLERAPWTLQGKTYIGAAHGDIGIIPQIVLSVPSLTPQTEPLLADALNVILEDDLWIARENFNNDRRVHWCHGPPGIVIGLKAIRNTFPSPSLRQAIDAVIAKGQALTWKEGVLKKEPNLCHGIHGNALALEPEQRDHFLSLATPADVAEDKWERSSDPHGLLFGEAGRAWVWALLDGGREGFPAFTDV